MQYIHSHINISISAHNRNIYQLPTDIIRIQIRI